MVAALGALSFAPAAMAGKPGPKPPPPPPPPPTTVATAYSGDAQVVDAHVEVLPLLGSPIVADVDVTKVGPLPSTGGFMHDSLLTVAAGVPPYLGVFGSVASAATAGAGDRSHSSASVVGAAVGLDALGLDIKIRAAVLRASADAKCGATGAEVKGSSSIAELDVRVGGLHIPIVVGTAPNQTVNLTLLGIPIAKLVINEQIVGTGSITVNALHLTVPKKSLLGGVVAADVIISHAHADIVCQGGDNPPPPPPCQVKDFVTGGGQVPGVNGQRVSFGMVGGEKPNGLSGHLNVVDHGAGGQHIKGTTLTKYEVLDATTRRLTYTGTVDNAAATIVVTVSDKGEPGTFDTFKVTTTTGYSATGDPITRGNLQLHVPNCGTTSTGGGGKPGGPKK